MTHCNKDNDNRHPSKNDAKDASPLRIWLTVASTLNTAFKPKPLDLWAAKDSYERSGVLGETTQQLEQSNHSLDQSILP